MWITLIYVNKTNIYREYLDKSRKNRRPPHNKETEVFGLCFILLCAIKMIVVQKISTTWSKKSRGMPGAAKRNAVPRKLTIPFYVPDVDGIYAHEVNGFERSDFKLEQSTKFFKNTRKYWSLDFVEDEKKRIIEIFFAYNASEHGQPNRGAYRRPLFKLSAGEWGAFHINGRFASYSGQWYCQHFVNIANTENVQPNIFLESEEKCFVDKTAHLF